MNRRLDPRLAIDLFEVGDRNLGRGAEPPSRREPARSPHPRALGRTQFSELTTGAGWTGAGAAAGLTEMKGAASSNVGAGAAGGGRYGRGRGGADRGFDPLELREREESARMPRSPPAWPLPARRVGSRRRCRRVSRRSRATKWAPPSLRQDSTRKTESSLGETAPSGGVDSNTLLKRFLRGFMGRRTALQAPPMTCISGPVSSQTGEGRLFSQGPPNCRNRPLC